MKILAPTEENITYAAEKLKSGEIIGMPTETVYGLAASVFNEIALAKVFQAKERPTFDPLIVHVTLKENGMVVQQLSDMKVVDPLRLTEKAAETIEKVGKNFWPGPLTIVLPKNSLIPDLATAGLPTVAVRVPSHPVARELLRLVGTPIAAPSANRFGKISPVTAQNVADDLDQKIELVLDGGACEVGLESSVFSIDEGGRLKLLRPGGVSKEAVEKVVGASVVFGETLLDAKSSEQGVSSPGLLTSHYAPSKSLFILPASVFEFADHDNKVFRELVRDFTCIGLMVLQGDARIAEAKFQKCSSKNVIVKSISENGDQLEAARNLFKTMRELDNSSAQVIFCEPCKQKQGLWLAISDRLLRASSGRVIS